MPWTGRRSQSLCYGKLDKKWIELYCKGDWESCIRYQMEERGEPHPDWMLPDGSIDERLHKLL